MGGASSTIDAKTADPAELRRRLQDMKIDVPAKATPRDLIAMYEEATRPKPSLFKQVSDGYSELVGAIIRPPRVTYEVAALGRTQFRIEGIAGEFERTDLELVNTRGQKLVCSWWALRAATAAVPTIVYLHGNSSCRAEAIDVIPTVLGSGCSLFAFDFAGCGLSQGEYVSLGYFESQDLKVIVDYLRASGRVTMIGLWGRSMGAVTAIMYTKSDPSIACMVLDSPFSSLRGLSKDLVDNAQVRVPRFAVNLGLRAVRSSIKSRANFDISELEPIDCVPQCFVPALFGAGEDDDFIPPDHARALHAAYGGDKNLVIFQGDHNTPRPEFFLHSAAIFLHNRLVAPGEAPVSDVAPSHHASVGARFVMPAPMATSSIHDANVFDAGFAHVARDQEELVDDEEDMERILALIHEQEQLERVQGV